jgi:hypothetical protein
MPGHLLQSAGAEADDEGAVFLRFELLGEVEEEVLGVFGRFGREFPHHVERLLLVDAEGPLGIGAGREAALAREGFAERLDARDVGERVIAEVAIALAFAPRDEIITIPVLGSI